jgi:mRNA interferase RelE/StbE
MLNIKLGNPAKKFLRKCEKQIYKRLIDKIRKLAVNPFPQDVKRIVGKKEKIFRIRVGNYRIQYAVFHEENLILITDVDKRAKAYE